MLIKDFSDRICFYGFTTENYDNLTINTRIIITMKSLVIEDYKKIAKEIKVEIESFDVGCL